MESTQYWKKAALQASRSLNLIDTKLIDQVLSALADAAEANATQILAANAKDLAAMDKTNPMYDRLLLTEERIAGIAADIRNVASLPSPLGRKLMETTRPNGMTIEKVSCLLVWWE
jgi:glutamate-5-semialdehyde dehydrogenase